MIKALFSTSAALCLLAGTAQARDAEAWSAPAGNVEVRSFPPGTELMLRLKTDLSTKSSLPGERVELELAQPLMDRAAVVLPVGTRAVGEVANVQRNGHLGRKGKLAVRLLYLDSSSGRVQLNGGSQVEGESGTALSVATIVFVSPLGFLIHGTSARMLQGTTVQAYTAEDLRYLAPAKQTAMAYAERDGSGAGAGSFGGAASDR